MSLIQKDNKLFSEIKELIQSARQRVAVTVNAELTLLYWQVGKRISEEVLKGERGEYGKKIIEKLSYELTTTFGKGWSKKQLLHCLRFVESFPDFPIVSTLSRLLSWSHFLELIYLKALLAIDFYIDLLFYNRKLKRLVAIDLKIGNFKAEYKGQMELYLRWLAKYEQEKDENLPLGIILCTGKKNEQIELLELDKSGIHVAEYLTNMPSKEILETKLHQAIINAKQRIEARTGVV